MATNRNERERMGESTVILWEEEKKELGRKENVKNGENERKVSQMYI